MKRHSAMFSNGILFCMSVRFVIRVTNTVIAVILLMCEVLRGLFHFGTLRSLNGGERVSMGSNRRRIRRFLCETDPCI